MNETVRKIYLGKEEIENLEEKNLECEIREKILKLESLLQQLLYFFFRKPGIFSNLFYRNTIF